MTHTTLHLRHARTPPDLASLDVKRRVRPRLLGRPATVCVIGSSHYVGVPGAGFHELCSCKPIDGPTVEDLPLARSLDRRVTFERPGLSVTTRIEGRPLAAFPGPDEATVAYRFGPDAYTTIDIADGTRPVDGVGDTRPADGATARTDGGDGTAATVETYHTYPEYDLALWTRTAIERVPGPDGRPADTHTDP